MTDAKQIAKYVSIGAGIFMIILAICLIATAIGRSMPATGDTWRYEPEDYSGISSLKLELGAGEIKIEQGDRFLVVSNLRYVDVKVEDNTLLISERTHAASDYEGAFFTMYIPEKMSLAEIDISTGAGTFDADKLSAEALGFEFGAGEVNIDELYATREAEIVGGAGQITIGGGELHNLELVMGVGQLNLTSKIVGEGELDLGVGEVNITLLGGQDSYTVEMNKGIGDITVNGESLSGNRTIGMGDSFVEVNGGIGSVNIAFK